ncbi:MAG: hypothetical protein ACXIUM_09470 [Wenzhouxiangella sp.]
MLSGLNQAQSEVLLERMAKVLDEQLERRRTLTYLELADRLPMPGPQRIHRTTRLLEELTRRDLGAGRPIRAALAVSRTGSGLPAPGFFDHTQRLGLHDGSDPKRFHNALLQQLYDGLRTDSSSPPSYD